MCQFLIGCGISQKILWLKCIQSSHAKKAAESGLQVLVGFLLAKYVENLTVSRLPPMIKIQHGKI